MDASGEICPGCSSMYNGACNIARIIPGCSHNLCEKCIFTEGTNTGQVKCRSPGCSTSTPWTNRPDQFVPNMLILGIVTYRQLCLSQVPVPGNSADVLENVNHEIVDVTGSSQPQDDKCDVICGECEESTADCLCQSCHSCLCLICFDKVHKTAKSHKSLPIVTDCNGQKMEEKVKLSNCTHHGKKIEYVAEGGEVGCAQCVIFGNLKGFTQNKKNVEDGTEDDDCSSRDPPCKSPSGKLVWVQCNGCQLWFPLFCLGMKPTQIKKDEDYICSHCKDHFSKGKRKDGEKETISEKESNSTNESQSEELDTE